MSAMRATLFRPADVWEKDPQPEFAIKTLSHYRTSFDDVFA